MNRIIEDNFGCPWPDGGPFRYYDGGFEFVTRTRFNCYPSGEVIEAGSRVRIEGPTGTQGPHIQLWRIEVLEEGGGQTDDA